MTPLVPISEACNCFLSLDFDWWGEYENVDGEEMCPGEYSDEVIYNFFDCEELVAV